MEFGQGFATLHRYWVSILIITAIAGASSVTYSLWATPTYKASSQVFVSLRTGGTTSDLLQGSNFTQNRVKSYADMVTIPVVLNPVIAQLALPTTADALARSIAADSPLDTVLINITVTDENPKTASDVANATAESLGGWVSALEKPLGSQSSPVRISSLRTATVPTMPASPRPKHNLAFGLLIGLALGVGLAALREVLDTLIRTQNDVANVTEAPVMARIAVDEDASVRPLIVQSSPHSHRSEAFRRLRTNLQFLDFADRPRTIVVTSPLAQEGKTTTAINLAITLADAGSRVALVDGDLRRPSVAEFLGLEGAVGLTTVLIGKADLRDAIQPWGNGTLHVLPSGQVPPNPSELLGSRSMADLLELLTSQYDIVLIDTPPLLPVTDAAILAKITGGALVVAAAGMVRRQQLADALRTLDDVGARVLGVVLNRVAHTPADNYTYYDYSAAPATVGPDDQNKADTLDTGRTRASRSGRRRTSPQAGRIKAAVADGSETGLEAVPVSSPEQ